MHRADAGAGQHGERPPAPWACTAGRGRRVPRPVPEHGGGGVDLFIDILARVDPFAVHLGGHPDQRRIFRLRGQPSVDGVVTEIGLAAHEPLGEGRPGEVQHGLERRFPTHPAGLLAPESVPVVYRSVMEIPGFAWLSLLSCIRLLADCFLLQAFGSFWWANLARGLPQVKILPRVYAARAPGWCSNEPVLKFGRIPRSCRQHNVDSLYLSADFRALRAIDAKRSAHLPQRMHRHSVSSRLNSSTGQAIRRIRLLAWRHASRVWRLCKHQSEVNRPYVRIDP